ncbi:CatB-related O-acetyltransferase [Polaribacter sp. M15]
MKFFLKKIIKFIVLKFKFKEVFVDFSASISMDTKLSKNVKILKNANLGNCQVGSYSYIGANCNFSNTKIQSFCSIGPDVICGLGAHPTNFVSTYPGFYSRNASGSYWFGNILKFQEESTTYIGSDVWIGARVIIKGGVTIGTGAIIGAGAVITKDVPPYSIVGGVPAKVIKYRFKQETINSLIESEWWNCEEKALSKLSMYMDKPILFLDKLKDYK